MLKPADLPLSEDVKLLQRTLVGQNKPVEVNMTSDGLTWVSIENYRSPERFTSTSMKILPGNYQVVGRRNGYRDVVLRAEIRNGVSPPAIPVTCTIPMPPGP